MKRNAIICFAISILLSLVMLVPKLTGVRIHMILTLFALIALGAYTVLSQRRWKIKALEIFFRLFFLIAATSGILIITSGMRYVLHVVHLVSAVLYIVLFIATFIVDATNYKKKF